MATDEVILDFQRKQRIGFEEAVFCQGKTLEQLNHILSVARSRNEPLLLTRLSSLQLEGLDAGHRQDLDYDEISRTAYFSFTPSAPQPPQVALVAAGSSDAFVFREVSRTLGYHGVATAQFLDVGVAGLWRLLNRIEDIRRFQVIVAVAGMDAALPTVLGGLVSGVVIAVPTSTGYGVAQGGHTALNAMLASCAPGIVTMNIDNGYGAACAALRVLHVIGGLR